MKNNVVKIFGGVCILIVILCVLYGIIYLFVQLQADNNTNLPSFIDIARRFAEQFADSKVLMALFGITLKRLGISLLLASILGLIFGFAFGSRKIWTYTQPTVDFMRSIPVTFFIPVMAIICGTGEEVNIYLLTIYPTMLLIMFGVRTGLMKQDLERAHFFKIIASDNFRSRLEKEKLVFFEALPDIFSGFRVALSYGLVIVTVLEYTQIGIADGIGIGYLSYDYYNLNKYNEVFALILLIGSVGFTLNKITEVIQHKWIHWSNENLKTE